MFSGFYGIFEKVKISNTKMSKKISTEIAMGIILIVAIIVGGLIWIGNKKQDNITSQAPNTLNSIEKKCSQELKICYDGTSVKKTGSNCEFAECPEIKLNKFCHSSYSICFDYPADAYVMSDEYATDEKEACNFHVGKWAGEVFMEFDGCNFFSKYKLSDKLKDIQKVALEVWEEEKNYNNPHVKKNVVSEVEEIAVGNKKAYKFSLFRDWESLKDESDTFIFITDVKKNLILIKHPNATTGNIHEIILESLKLE